MSINNNEESMLSRLFKPELMLLLISYIISITVIFTSLDGRVNTLEQLRLEDQSRIERRLEDMQKSLNRIVDWQIDQKVARGSVP